MYYHSMVTLSFCVIKNITMVKTVESSNLTQYCFIAQSKMAVNKFIKNILDSNLLCFF